MRGCSTVSCASAVLVSLVSLAGACGSSGGDGSGASDAASDSGTGSSSSSSGGGSGSSSGGGGPTDASVHHEGGGSSSGSGSGSSGGSSGSSSGAGADGGGVTRCKRGIAANAGPTAPFAHTATSPGVWWWYDWSPHGTGQDPAIELVPMIWGTADLTATIPAGSKTVLGFNEPNFKAQSNLTPQQAATDWPMVESIAAGQGAALASPAVNFCGSSTNPSGCSDPSVTDPYTWLKDFFNACSGCKVDAIAVHWYNCDLPSLQAYIDGNSSLQGFVQFGKPIWLTEFSCDGSHSVADQQAYMKAAVPYLEGNAHVARYSWFSASPIPNAQLADSTGALTALGQTYVSLPQSCP